MISRLAVLTLLCATINAQLQPYSSQPLIWQTFDTNPGTRPNTSRSLFSWARGNPPNTGIAVFNGVNNFIDLTYYADDRGSYFPTTLTRSFSLEYWIQFDAVNPWSRIFECGNGQGQDNINVANMDRTTNLAWSIDAGADGKQNTRVVANNAIMRGTFQHIVLTVEQQNASEITRGDLDVYVDGVLRATNRNAYLPRVTRRPDVWIGKSYYPGDGWFNGLLDDFFMYDHSISAEAVQAHFVLPRPPVYELTFSVDPRLISGRPFSEYKYKWSSDGAGNSSSTSKFGGYLLINGSDDHVDLALTSYTPAWVGTKAPLPQIGVVAETGANNTLPLGWTIELTFTPLTIENWAKVFDIGSGAPLDNIILGYEGSSNSLRFEYFIGTQAQETMNIASLAVDKSYHVVIVMIPSSITSTTGAIEIYVNGRPVDARNNIPMPRPVRRANAYIGRSHWASDEYFDCLLDSFRMYDYSLTGDEIQSLYEVTREAADQDLDPDSNVYRTGPTRQYTFRDAPPAAAMTNSAFQWAANLTNNATSGDWHRGIAVFNGSGQWIDLNRFPDDYGQGSIMPKFGNSVSFEVWARWSAFRRFSRIFDFGREFNSNAYSLILANTGSTNELLFESRNSQSQLSTVPSVRNALQLNRWIHIVVTVEQVSVNDSSSARAALYSVFINGVARESARGYLPFPTRRLSSYIGRSNYQADENFAGAIDSFMYYDYALQYEQIAAHHKLYKVPIFELAFSKDPRPWLGLTNATYAWEAYDPSDQQSNNTQFHNGHLVLMDKQWVNLTATTGQNSLGTAFAEAISGRLFGPPVYGAYSGPQSNTFRGWTIELLAKIMTLDNGAKLFSCASATRTNEVSIGWYGPNNLLALVVQQGTSEPVYFPFMDTRDLDPKAWYHFVVVANTNNNYNNADYNVYVDGVRVHTRSGVTNPARVARPLCALGRSVVDPSSTQYFRAKIDTLRFIDYALSPSQVTELYDLTHDYLPPVVQPVYDTAPLIQYTFDDQPDSSKFIDGTYFSWDRGTGVHQGIAKFNGVDQWINLISFPDDAGIPFPAVYGNSSFSFAAWVKFDGVRQWSRIFDSAAGTATDNVLLGMSANTTGLAFHVYRQDNTVNSQINTNPGVWKVGQWQHVVVTCSDRSRTNSSVVRGSSTQNLMQVFVDGRLVSERFGYLPRGVERPTTYLGKSHWVADQLMFGSIDSFYMYEYALSGEQVLLHAALPRPPVFDLSFAIDPRSLLPTSSVRWGYEWQEFDPSDSFGNGTAFHSGHVVLNHTRSDYINLSQLSGANTLGLLLPRIGGPSSGIGLTTPGWTFEWTIKINSVGAGRRIMDWGNGPTSNNIILGFGSIPNMLQFSVNSSSQLSTMDLLAVVPGEWIHIVVTLRPQSGSSDMSTWVGYVNGVQERTMTGVTPAPVRRNSALLGRSNAAGTPVYCSVNIDNIRVFDWVVSAQQVQTMYSISHDPSVDPVLPSSSSSTGGRGSSSSRAASSSSGSRRTCTWGGNYPNCFCSCDTKFTTYPNCDHCDPLPPAAAGSGPLSFVEIVSLCVLILGVASMLGLCAFCFYRKSRMSGFSQFNNNLYDSEKNSVSMTSTRPGYDGSITNDASSTYDWRAAAAAEQDQNQWQGQQQDYQFGNQYQQPQY